MVDSSAMFQSQPNDEWETGNDTYHSSQDPFSLVRKPDSQSESHPSSQPIMFDPEIADVEHDMEAVAATRSLMDLSQNFKSNYQSPPELQGIDPGYVQTLHARNVLHDPQPEVIYTQTSTASEYESQKFESLKYETHKYPPLEHEIYYHDPSSSQPLNPSDSQPSSHPFLNDFYYTSQRPIKQERKAKRPAPEVQEVRVKRARAPARPVVEEVEVSEVEEASDVDEKKKKKKPKATEVESAETVLGFVSDEHGLRFPRQALTDVPNICKRISKLQYLALGLFDKLAFKYHTEWKGREIRHALDAFPLTLSGDGTGGNEGKGRLQNVLHHPQDAYGCIRSMQLKVPMRYAAHMHLQFDKDVAQRLYSVQDLGTLQIFMDVDHKITGDCIRMNSIHFPLNDFESEETDNIITYHVTLPIDLRVNNDSRKKREKKVYDSYQTYLSHLLQPANTGGDRKVKRRLKEQEQNMALTVGIRSNFANDTGTPNAPRFVEEVLWRCDNFIVANVQKDLHFDGMIVSENTQRFEHPHSKPPFIRLCDCPVEVMDVRWDA